MATFYTADQHFGHKNIITYCNRPFGSVDQMNNILVDRWNSVVNPDDTVHMLGDICMGDNPDRMKHIARLNGHKILYPGNHDSCWRGYKKHSFNKNKLYYDAGFEDIIQDGAWINLEDHRVLLYHFPYIADSHDKDRFDEFRPTDNGDWLIHGHIHDKWQVRDKMINVGVDMWDFYPVHESTIIDIIKIY